MSSEGITKQEDIRNALESRNSVPSYLDLSESHHNDDMFALKKNVLRVRWLPTMDSGSNLIGQVQWNNIQPPNMQTGISKMFINCDLEMTIAITDATTAGNVAKVGSVFNEDHIFMQDINAALYNTQINITGQSLTGQPYIDLPIKRLYDPDFYDPTLSSKKKDKNVWSKITYDSATATATVKYHCATPLIHPFFSSDNDLAGVNAFTINTNYNLSQLFNIFNPALSGTTATSSTTITPTITKLDWRISYNQINYEKPLNDYITLLMWEAYFTEKNQTNIDSNQLYINNVRDIPSTPICQYALIVRRVEDNILSSVPKDSANYPNGAIPMLTLESIDITVNSNSNAYNTTNFTDIVHCCRQAGYLGSIEELTTEIKKYPPVYAFSSLQYRNIVGSANTYRFNVNSCNYETTTDAGGKKHIINDTGSNFQVYYVMMQPALFMSNTQGSAFVNNLGVPFSAMIKSDSDIDAYIKLLEQSGYSGGSLRDWLLNLRDRLKKGRYISNAGKTIGRLMDSPIVKQAASMIPVVGPAIGSHWDTAKNVVNAATAKAEELGYGVNMF